MSGWSAAVPELPVQNLEAALGHYRDVLGFHIAWHRSDDGIAGVARDECAIFLRQSAGPHEAASLWIHCEALEEVHRQLAGSGAVVVDPPKDKPWGLRQFTVTDPEGHRLIFHCELG